MDRLKLAFRYAARDRLADYRRLLERALARGYRLCSVSDSLDLDGTRRLVVLRHDVDRISPGTAAMLRIERELGVTATYYFRRATYDQGLIEQIAGAGFEASFHYETIADFAAREGISTRSALEATDYRRICADLLERDLAEFRTMSGQPCLTISSHGALLNTKLGLRNVVLFDDPSLHGRLGIRCEAYDRTYLKTFEVYISDTLWEIDDGFRRGRNPFAEIEKGTGRIMLLTHPNNWGFDIRTRARRVVKAILLGRIREAA